MPQSPPPGAVRIADLPPRKARRLLTGEFLTRQRRVYGGNDDVWGVEIGYREAGGRLVLPREPCLKVYVFRKGLTSHREIPPWSTITLDGVTFALQTDVEPVAQAKGQAGHVTAAPEVNAGRKSGSGFYVIRTGGEAYLVTAAHVLQGLSRDGMMTTWSKAGIAGRGPFVRRSTVFWPPHRDPATNNPGFGDFGLAKVTDLGPYADPSLVPQATSVRAWDDILGVDGVRICGKNTQRLARFTARVPAGYWIPVPGYGNVPYWRLLRFALGSHRTFDGDSGAPILDASGALVGMHVAIKRADRPVRFYSLALCAGDILAWLQRALGDPHLTLAASETEG
jgi:hypothetical protein